MPQWSIQIALLKFNLLSPHATLTLTTALTPIIREFFSSTNRVVLMYTCNPLHFFKSLTEVSAGVTIGDPVLRTGKPLSVELGPGMCMEPNFMCPQSWFVNTVSTYRKS